jgi:hypothetical protein
MAPRLKFEIYSERFLHEVKIGCIQFFDGAGAPAFRSFS